MPDLLELLFGSPSGGGGTMFAGGVGAPSAPAPPIAEPVERPKLKPEGYVQLVNSMWDQADRAYITVRYMLDAMWGLYNNQYRFRKKEWQFQGWVPKMQDMIDAKSALLEDAMMRSNGRYFSIDPQRSMLPNEAFADIFERLLRAYLHQMHFTSGVDVAGNNTTGGFVAQITMAQLGFIAPNVGVTRNSRGFIRHTVDWVRPWDVRLDPLGRGMWSFRRTIMDLSEFKATVDEAAPDQWDEAAVDAIHEDYTVKSDDEEQQIKEGLGYQPNAANRKLIKLITFTGNLDDQSGKRLHTNAIITVANEKHLVQGPLKNPFPLGLSPLFTGHMRRVPFMTYPTPPAYGVSRMAYGLTELFNLMMDTAVLEGLPMFESSLRAFVNPAQVRMGVKPGQIFWRNEGSQSPMLRRVETSGAGSETVRGAMGYLNTEMGNTVQPQLEYGSPTGERVSATESSIKNSLLSKLTLSQVRRLEETGLQRILTRIYLNDLKWRRRYRGDPLVESVLTEDEIVMLESLTPAQRQDMVEGTSLEVKGISGMLERDTKIEELDQFLNRLGRITPNVPQLQHFPWLSSAALYGRWLDLPDQLQTWLDRVAMQAEQVQQQTPIQVSRETPPEPGMSPEGQFEVPPQPMAPLPPFTQAMAQGAQQ